MGDKTISDEQIIDDARMFTKIWSRKYNVDYSLQEELKQEISVALLEARERFDPEKAKWSTYAGLRSRGAAIDFLRRVIPYSQRYILLLDKPVNIFSEEESETMMDYFTHTRDDQTQIEVMELLNGINERYKRIILCLIFGYRQNEIAQMLGLSEDRVWQLTKTIRENLAEEN